MKPIRVLIIDDSAFARKVLREVLTRDPQIEIVGIARDGLEGLEKISDLKPDVVTLDLIMPDLDGIGVLKALQLTWSPRVVIVSVSGSETELAIEALQLGAVDLVAKPTAMATDRMYELSDELINKVKAAASAKPRAMNVEVPPAITFSAPGYSSVSLVAVGTSTGGPQALSEFFKTLPAGLPNSFAVALHIPAGYTAPLAARISLISEVKVTEAENGMEFLPGNALIAPGGMHLKVRVENDRMFAVVTRLPFDTPHHPSVDVLFESVAAALGPAAIGIVLTGMGDDGMAGSKAIRKAGGRVLAESESSCVVYGMPRSVIEAGYATAEAPLEQMVPLLVRELLVARNTSEGDATSILQK